MSKNIKIAALGIAALATAAAPMMAMATDVTSQVDKIWVTIDPTCSMATIAHSDGATGGGAWGTTIQGETDTSDILAGTLANGTNIDNYGSTSFTVICNNLGGWEVKATNTALTGAATGQTISARTDHSATQSGWSWTVSQATGVGLTIPENKQGSATDASVAKLTTATDKTGKTFKVTYGVGISESQAADTYKGQITYTLSQLQPAS